MELPQGSEEALPDIMPCLPADLATNKASSPTPSRDEYDPQNADKCNPHQHSSTPIPTDDDEMWSKLNLRRDAPNMAGLEATAAAAAATDLPMSNINNASAPTTLAEHDNYIRNLRADWDNLPAEFPYKRSKRDERKSKVRFAERKENVKNSLWKANLEALDEVSKELQENQKQWADPNVMMKKVMTKMKKEKNVKKEKRGKKEGMKDKDWYEKMLAGPWQTSGPTKKLRRTVDGWQEVDIDDDEAEAMAERKQLRKKQIFPYNTWKWDSMSSSDETEARTARVVAAAIKMLEKMPESDDKNDEPIMHSLLSDEEAIAADPPLGTKEEKAKEKAKKQECGLIEKEKKAREGLRPLLHPFFRDNKHSADHILHAGALPVEVLKNSQFFPVPADVRKVKTALYKQKYEEKMAVKAKKDKVKRNRVAKKQRRFEARREKRSAYAHRLAVKGWDFSKEALTGYEDAIAKARIIPIVMLTQNHRKAPTTWKKALSNSDTIPLLATKDSDTQDPKQLLPTLPLAPEYARNPDWTFPVWDDEMAWTEYDMLPGRFEAISKIIKDDDWHDQFVKGSKLDQELMRTIVVPVWNRMTYEEKTTVLGGQRVDPACFWSDGENDGESNRVTWPHPSKSDSDFLKCAGSCQGEITEPDSLKRDRSILCTDMASFEEGEMIASLDTVETPTAPYDSFKSSVETGRSPPSPEKASSEDGEDNESDSWQSASFSSNINRVISDREETDGSTDDSQTPAAPEDSLVSNAAYHNNAKMPTLSKEVDVSDFEEPLDNTDPDLDLNMLFQRVGEFCQGEEASASPFISASRREAELIFNLLRKEAVVRHWLPERTFSYDNAAWKTRVPIFDPDNKAASNLAVFPPGVKEVRNIEYSDPESRDLSLPDRNNILHAGPNMQTNWIAIADEYRLGLNGRQRLTKPAWANNYDLIRAQQPDPLIYMPKDTLEFEEVRYFSEVLPKPLVFPDVKEGSYDSPDWIWQKHCMDQRIGLHPGDQRPEPNATISNEGVSDLIGDNLPPEDESLYTNGSISYKKSSGVPSFMMPDVSDVPAEIGARMLKELEELYKPVPETEALGRPPPAKYIQPHDTPAAVLMKIYQEEYDEFRKECPEPTSIRFEREVYVEEAPISLEKGNKEDMDDYLAKMDDEEQLDFLKDVRDAINELVAPGLDDTRGPLEIPVGLTGDITPSVGSVRRRLDFRPKLKVDELVMKHAREDIPLAGSEPVTQRPYTPVVLPGSDAGSPGMSVISETLSRRSKRYSLRDVGHEKPSPRVSSAMQKAPLVLSAASSAKLNRALDASKARILRKMEDRGESAEKQASMAATLDMFKHSESVVPQPASAPESHVFSCNKDINEEKAKPATTLMTPAKARALIDYLIDDAPPMEEGELKENIIDFFDERFFVFALTELDLSPVNISEEEANAYLQQRYEAHKLIEEAEEAKTKDERAKEAKAKKIEPVAMSKREAQYLFQSTLTSAKARALLNWAKRTQPSLYIKHMLAPGLLEYCETKFDAAIVAVTDEEGMKFIAWNMKMRESGRNVMELHSAVQDNDVTTGEDKSEFRPLRLISAAKGRALLEWLFANRPDLEFMKLLSRGDLDRIICSKDYHPVHAIENEAIASFNLLSKRAMEISRAQREGEEDDETFPLFEEETQKSNSVVGSMVSHGVDDPEDDSEFGDTFENDPQMSPALAVQLMAWVLDVRPHCDPEHVLGQHFIRYASQYQGPESEPLEDDEAFSIFKNYALAQQIRTSRIKVLHGGSERKPNKEDDACSDVLSHHPRSEESVLEKFPEIEPPAPSHSPGSEEFVAEKFPDIDIDSPPVPQKTSVISDTVRLRLKPSQVREFLAHLKGIHGHCDFKDQTFDRMVKAYIQLPDSAPTKDFAFSGQGLNVLKQMVMAEMIDQRKRQHAFEDGRVAYSFGAGTGPDIRRERGDEVENDVEKEAYNPNDDMYEGISRLFGSMGPIPRFHSPRGSFRGSFGSSLGGSSNQDWLGLPSEASGSIIRCSNRGLFIRKRVSHAFDPISPHETSTEDGRLRLRRNPSYRSQHDGDRNQKRSSSPLISASPGGFALGFSLPEQEQNENDPQSPTPARKRGANCPIRTSASERSSSPVPLSEDSDNPWRPLIEGRVSQRLSATETFPSRARAETPPPASFASCPSEDSYQYSTDWGTASSVSMTFSQFQAMRRNYRLEEAKMGTFFSPYGANSFDNDVETHNAGHDDEDDELSDMEAYEAWYNAIHGVTPEALEKCRRYFEEEQMIDEMPDDPEMFEKVLGVLAKIDENVTAAHTQAIEEVRIEEEKEVALRGGVARMVDDDPAHALLHTLDPKKEFMKTLLKIIESEHLDAEEIEMLFEKIEERDAPTEYEWVDENGEPLEESDWDNDSEEKEGDIDQNYHVQEHQERMQLNFEQCEYEGALARVEAWKGAHEEHADPEFPQREIEADEARKAEYENMETIVKAWELSKPPLTVPNTKRARHGKTKALCKKKKASLGNAQNSQGPFPSEPEALPKKDETPLLKDQIYQGSVRSRRAPQRVSYQVTVQDEPLEAEQSVMVAETSIPQEEKLSRMNSFESRGYESKDVDIGVPLPTPSLRSASEDAANETLSRKKNLAVHLGLKPEDLDSRASSPTTSPSSVSRGISGMTSKKLTKTRKPSANDARTSTPSRETFSPAPSMAPSASTPGAASLSQRIASAHTSRLDLKSKHLNTSAPSPTPSFCSVSQDLPRRVSKKLTKKRKPEGGNARPLTPSICPSESAPRSTSVGQRVTSIFKREDKEEVEDKEGSGLIMMKRMKSLKFKKDKKDK